MSTQDDLEYVREVAERGASKPLGGGRTLLWWGVVMTLALLIHYAIGAGLLFDASWGYLALWVTAVLLGWIGTYIIIGRTRAGGGTLTHAGQTNSAVWMAGGIFLTFFAFAIVARQTTAPLGVHMFDLIVAVATGVYGIAFATTASVAQQRWLWMFALLAFGFSGLFIFMLGDPRLYLFAAFGTAVVIGLPGFLLMRAK